MMDWESGDGFAGRSGKRNNPNHDYDHEAYMERKREHQEEKPCAFCGKAYDESINQVHVQWVMEMDMYVCDNCTEGSKSLTIAKLFDHFKGDRETAIEFLKFVKL